MKKKNQITLDKSGNGFLSHKPPHVSYNKTLCLQYLKQKEQVGRPQKC